MNELDECRRVWVCKRCGNCLDHCKHKDESNFHEDLVMPCSVKLPASSQTPPVETLDDKALAEIQARVNAATEGPWNPRERNPDCQVVAVPSVGVEGELVADCLKGDDTWFITHARTDIPALCQSLRGARALSRDLAKDSARIAKELRQSQRESATLREQLAQAETGLNQVIGESQQWQERWMEVKARLAQVEKELAETPMTRHSSTTIKPEAMPRRKL